MIVRFEDAAPAAQEVIYYVGQSTELLAGIICCLGVIFGALLMRGLFHDSK